MPRSIATSSRASGGRTDRLVEALVIGRDHPRGGRDHGRRASVVRREHDAASIRVVRREAEDATHVGQPPGVDRLVVVADHEQVVLRRREKTDEPQLGGIDVLELVDADVAGSATASAGGGAHRSRAARTRARRGRRSRPLRGCAGGRRTPPGSGARRAAARDPRPSTPTATCPACVGSSDSCRASSARVSPAPGGSKQRQAIGDDVAALAGVEEHLPREGVKRADLDRGRVGHRAPRAAARRGQRGPWRRRLLNVTTQIRSGATPRESSTASRATIVVVLPLPAGAMIWAGPSGSVAAARCSGSSAARIGSIADATGTGA